MMEKIFFSRKDAEAQGGLVNGCCKVWLYNVEEAMTESCEGHGELRKGSSGHESGRGIKN